MKTRNEKLKNTVFYCKFLLLVLLFTQFFVECKKNKDEPKFITSERQLYSFTQGTAGFYSNSPTLVGNSIYIGSSRGYPHSGANDNAFYKLDENLNMVWEYPLGINEVKGAAALDEFGNIYFVVGAGNISDATDLTLKLFSLDNNGDFRWSKVIMSNNSASELFGTSSPAISNDNIIYVGGDNFYAFDIDGNELWNYTPSSLLPSLEPIMTAPIIDPDGNIYFNEMRLMLTSLDKNGTKRWSALEGNNCWVSSPAFSVDYSKIIFATYDSLFCISSQNGNIVWRYHIPGMTGDFRCTPAVDNNDNIYIGTHGEFNDDSRQTLYAIKSDGSEIIWQTNIGSDIYSSPALGNDGILYVGSEDYCSRNGYKRLYGISMETGEIIWTAPLAMDITWSSPAISNSGILYIATMGEVNDEEDVNYDTDNNGKIYAFSTSSTGLLQNAGSPRFHEGNKSTGRRD